MGAAQTQSSKPTTVNRNGGGKTVRWTREQFHRMADLGMVPPDARVELIAGEIVEKMPQNRPHSISVRKGSDVVVMAFGTGYHVQSQSPIALAEDGEPEPIIVVLCGKSDDYPEVPTQRDALLVIEVSGVRPRTMQRRALLTIGFSI
jgi:Uma2 family endonuclease